MESQTIFLSILELLGLTDFENFSSLNEAPKKNVAQEVKDIPSD